MFESNLKLIRLEGIVHSYARGRHLVDTKKNIFKLVEGIRCNTNLEWRLRFKLMVKKLKESKVSQNEERYNISHTNKQTN